VDITPAMVRILSFKDFRAICAASGIEVIHAESMRRPDEGDELTLLRWGTIVFGNKI
jgi:hypothetical protein